MRDGIISSVLLAVPLCCALSLVGGESGKDNEAAQPIVAPVTAETVTPPELIAPAEAQIARLNSENFDERDAATRALTEFDIRLLPWLRKLLDNDKQAKKFDADVRNQLGTALKALQEKNELAILRYGTPVKLDFKQELASKIIAELGRQTDNPDLSSSALSVPEELRFDFKFEGIYWDALLQFNKLLPPSSPDKREIFLQNWARRRDVSNREAYLFSNSSLGIGIAGVAALRVGRVAWEADSSGRFLSVILVPHLEPRFKPQSINLELTSIVLDNGEKLTPLEPIVALNAQSGWYSLDNATFAAPVKDENKNCKSATLKLNASFEVFENRQIRQDLTQGLGPFKLPGGVVMNLTKSGESYTVRLEGAGATPQWENFNKMAFYDAGGEKLNTKPGGSNSYSGGGTGWKVEQTCTVPGVPAQLEVIVPVKRPKFAVPVEIKNVPLPFTPAPEAPAAPAKSSDK